MMKTKPAYTVVYKNNLQDLIEEVNQMIGVFWMVSLLRVLSEFGKRWAKAL